MEGMRADVGQPPWSARVPLDPPVADEFKPDEGVGCRGVRPNRKEVGIPPIVMLL
jgi:hypothetical protein